MLNTQRKGFMLAISSPSGAGKTTLSRLLLSTDSDLIMSVSVTTRPKREQERDGVDYFFVNQQQFDQMQKSDQLLEHAVVFGNNYGTPKAWVDSHLSAGKDVLFDIDWQGASTLSKLAGHDVVSVFILPPSIDDLKIRLQKRGQDSDAIVAERMAGAKNEISHYHLYDYVIINHQIEDSLQQLKSIARAERLKLFRQTSLTQFVDELLDI